MKNPEYLFETSWEVCNMVGGIYTVLSTKSNVMRLSKTTTSFPSGAKGH